MSQEEQKLAQDGQYERQDEARWRQDAKNEGCIERFDPFRGGGLPPARQQLSEPGGRGEVGEG